MITTSSVSASNLASAGIGPIVNIINGNALIILGGGIAFAINKLAHQIFSVQKNSHASTAISAVAFLAGASACYFAAPHAAIFALTMQEAVWIGLGVSISASVSKLITGKKNPILAMELALIPFVGLYGRVALIFVGTAAAGVGAIV